MISKDWYGCSHATITSDCIVTFSLCNSGRPVSVYDFLGSEGGNVDGTPCPKGWNVFALRKYRSPWISESKYRFTFSTLPLWMSNLRSLYSFGKSISLHSEKKRIYNSESKLNSYFWEETNIDWLSTYLFFLPFDRPTLATEQPSKGCLRVMGVTSTRWAGLRAGLQCPLLRMRTIKHL